MRGEREVLYRAMRPAERDATLAAGRPAFLHGHKFFSHDLGWIATRVRDGAFRGREAAPDDYACVLRFTVPRVDIGLFRRLNDKEWSLAARDAAFLRATISEVAAGEVAAAALTAVHAHRVGGTGRRPGWPLSLSR